MLDDFGKSQITVKKQDLLDKLYANRKAHTEALEIALVGYREKSISKLKKMLKAAEAGEKFDTKTGLPVPEDHTKEYDRVIQMMEMSVADTVTITESMFRQYVQDEWSWAESWKMSNSGYMNR